MLLPVVRTKKAAFEGSFMVRGHSKNHIFQISYPEVDKSLQKLEHLPNLSTSTNYFLISPLWIMQNRKALVTNM